jgi:actin-like ATPase involved in cell morphogenesis
MSDRQSIGIDFGTTKTLASRWDERSQRPIPIRLGRGTDEIPTSVHVDRKGHYTFGEDAEDQRACEPAGYFRRIKRDLGRDIKRTLPGGRAATSTELIARFLRDVRERIEVEALHGPVGHTVITVPALYGPAAKADLKAAAGNAGFTDFSLLEEPIAGGSAFLYAHPDSIGGRNFAVFDWGGGTLDLAVVQRNGDVLTAYPDLIGGNPELGGEDIDDRMNDVISEQLCLRGMAPLEKQPDEHRVAALRAITVGKQMLSQKPAHTFRLNLRDGPMKFEWTRTDFENFIINLVASATGQLTRLIEKSESAGVKLDGVLLIGGTSEIPLVARRIEELTKLKAHRYDYGQSAVALGAMLHARKKAPLPPLPINGADIEQAITLKVSDRGKKVQITIEVAGQPKTVRVKIPDDVIQGQSLRCSGLGMPGLNGGREGDLVLVVTELKPPVRRSGDATDVAPEHPAARAPLRGSDLRREHEVTPHTGLAQQIWAGGRMVSFTVPVEFSDGHIISLIGQGEPGKHGGANGNLIIVLKLPESKLPPSPSPTIRATMPPAVQRTDRAIWGLVGIVLLVTLGIVLLFVPWVGWITEVAIARGIYQVVKWMNYET